MKVRLNKSSALRGEVTPPPDKSISHRSVFFSSIAKGKSVIRNFLSSEDTLSTIGAFRALGVDIDVGSEITVRGSGLHGLREPMDVIDCGNSGTTMRLLSGVLSGCPFFSVLTGDGSLRSRPMKRVVMPLREMGAKIMGRQEDGYPPLAIRGGGLKGIRYEMPVASAQVKSALLLAGLYAIGETEVIESVRSRDHTERMLPSMGAIMSIDGQSVKVSGRGELDPLDITVPGDFSSAAFFMAAATIVEGSEVRINSVGLNPTRTGLLSVMLRMGADIRVENETEVSGETVGDLVCRHSLLKATDIGPGEVPSMIDEFPVFCVLAALAEGKSTISGAGELRVKESDRISATAEGLRAMGIEVDELEDGLSINGRGYLAGAEVDSRGDHRIAMAFSVAALVSSGETSIEGADAVGISYPGFYDDLERLWKG